MHQVPLTDLPSDMNSALIFQVPGRQITPTPKNSFSLISPPTAAGLPIVLPKESESVLVGAAILGARASGVYATVQVSFLIENFNYHGLIDLPKT